MNQPEDLTVEKRVYIHNSTEVNILLDLRFIYGVYENLKSG